VNGQLFINLGCQQTEMSSQVGNPRPLAYAYCAANQPVQNNSSEALRQYAQINNKVSQVEARLKASAITSFGYGNVEMLSGLHALTSSCLKLESWQCSGPQVDFKLGAKRA
jgi:hypothetical protein